VKRGKKAKDEVEIVHGASPRELWKKCGFNLADFPMYRVEYRAQLTDEEQKFLKGQHLLWDIRNYQSADDRPNIFDIQLVYPTKSTIPSRINVDSQARDAILKFWPEYSQKYILKEVASK
jgi:hypothetical protein